MITISRVVEELVFNEPFMLDLIKQDLINLSSLARKLKPEIEKRIMKPVNQGSVVVALNRLTPRISMQMKHLEKKNNIKFLDITVRSDLSDYTFQNSQTIVEAQRQLLNTLADNKNIFYTVSRGVFESTVVISSSHSDILEKIFDKEVVISKKNDLSCITVKLPSENTETPGLYYLIFKKVAWSNINIIEVISTTNEISLIIKDSEVSEVFALLKNWLC